MLLLFKTTRSPQHAGAGRVEDRRRRPAEPASGGADFVERSHDSRASARALRSAKLGAPLVLDAVCAGMIRLDSSRDRDFPGTVGRRFRGKNGAASAPLCPAARLLCDRTRTQAAQSPSIGVRLGVLPTSGLPELPSPTPCHPVTVLSASSGFPLQAQGASSDRRSVSTSPPGRLHPPRLSLPRITASRNVAWPHCSPASCSTAIAFASCRSLWSL